MGPAAKRWRDDLAAWAIPEHIRSQASADPWRLSPRSFPAAPAGQVDDDAARRRALEALPEGGTVLDVGAGTGRAGLVLIPPAARLVAVDESEEMLEALAARAQERGAEHLVVHGRWPDVAPSVGVADVVVSHHVVYNVPDLAPFVTALSDHARRRVVLEFGERHPVSGTNPLWKHFWGIDRPARPTGDDVLAVLGEAGIDAQVERARRPPRVTRDDDEWIEHLTRRLCLPPDRAPEVADAVRSLPPEEGRDVVIAWWSGSAA